MIEYFKDVFATPMGYNTFEAIGHYVTMFVGMLFTIAYMYQLVYIVVALVRKPKKYPETDQSKTYAILIAARNEEFVLPGLLKSIQAQTYPGDKIQAYVVADNCTDNTASAARELGAIVYERQDTERIGKGYALEFLLNCIKRDKGFRAYDAYMVIDADNILRNNYVAEMDKAHCAGYQALTSYRNSKNYGKNWISAGYSLWFMRESRHLNNPRSLLGTSAAISGTGFLISSEIIERNDGWKYFLLTEDIEFTIDTVIRGEKIGYCHDAELFDEQPETFRQSWSQRMRWAKGLFQIFRKYGKKLVKGAFKKWSCFDMTLNVMPAFILTVVQLGVNLLLFILSLIVEQAVSIPLLTSLLLFFVYAYGILFVFGLLAMVAEWKRIHVPKWKVILLLFTFPLFMITYIPISVVALFTHVEWKPIEHKYAMDTVDEVDQPAPKTADAAVSAAGTSETEN